MFQQNLHIMIREPLNIAAYAKHQYLRQVIHVEALHEFEILCTETGHTGSAHSKQIILGIDVSSFLSIHRQRKIV